MYSEIVHDIRNLKIQGAVNVAKEAVRAFGIKLDETYSRYKQEPQSSKINNIVRDLNEVKEELFSLRSTEPCLRNSLNYIFSDVSYTINPDELKTKLYTNIKFVENHFIGSKSNIIKFGSKRIESNMVVFTHCHASTVTWILIEAKKSGKSFVVHNTETRPLFQGRITAKELSDNDIKVQHFIDSSGRLALKNCDIMMIGADAILSDGTVINKIGSEMLAEIANRYDIPVYVCTDSWKFDPNSIFGFDEKIEQRDAKEIWENPPQNVKINNFAFEKIKSSLITGIISELGIYKPEIFVEEVINKYPLISRT